VDRVVQDVLEGLVVLLGGLDLFGPEPSAEDMVLPAVAVIEGAGVLAVEVSHPVGEIRERGFDEEVVVVAEQAAGVKAPAVAAADAPQDLGEDRAVPVVTEDRLVVIALRSDVVVGAGREVST
jgi:putative intracellular protease/amidase